MRGLDGTRALVTGGGGAIGGAICRRLAEAGCAVAVADRSEEGAAAVARELEDGGRRACAVAVDITDYEATAAAVASVEDELGELDVLVNCAGWDRVAKFLDTEPDLWDRLIAINLRGALNVTHAVVRRMAERRRGRVVTIASDAGRVGSSGEAVYAACKAGLIGFSKSLAREVASRGVLVNVVCPGPTDTPLLDSFRTEGGEYGAKIYTALERAIPLRRLGEPDDVAGIVAFFASEEARFITGQVVSVSGGLTMAG